MAATDLIPDPTSRKLRIYALDPSLAAQYSTAGIGEVSIDVLWEQQLAPGPVGEYLEVVDADPASNSFYHPVDLNDHRLLAQGGLAPSESNPQFHQQMAYAVAMATIGHFERALGRVALWSPHRPRDTAGHIVDEQFVRRLRIYPHALRDRNAYYSPEKKALLFGYFPAGKADEVNARDTIVFTVLSHDIVAHETTHALLDGVHPRFNDPMNVDVLAFHEAFADIVALFQHFSYPGVLRHQVARTRGNLAEENLLGQLAQQFGAAAGHRGALRDALGETDPKTGAWTPRRPNPHALDKIVEPHARGAVLVAAVFGAFLKVYRGRTQDLYRIASEGTGVLRPGELHPDLSNRLADEAARCAQYILQMCIRAIDYCPPVGITFGDYLRAIVTADYDLNREDPYGYRLAVIESFRQWGIHPRGMRSLSIESLLWPTGDEIIEQSTIASVKDDVRSLFVEEQTMADSEQFVMKTKSASDRPRRLHLWGLESDRYRVWQQADENAGVLWAWLVKGRGRKLLPALGIVMDGPVPPTVFRSESTGLPTLEVHSVRWAQRRNARGEIVSDLLLELLQRRRGYLDPEKQAAMDKPGNAAFPDDGDFRYRAGCTVLFDPRTMQVRRVIRTAGTIADDEELDRVRDFLLHGYDQPENSFWSMSRMLQSREPFAMLHRHGDH